MVSHRIETNSITPSDSHHRTDATLSFSEGPRFVLTSTQCKAALRWVFCSERAPAIWLGSRVRYESGISTPPVRGGVVDSSRRPPKRVQLLASQPMMLKDQPRRFLGRFRQSGDSTCDRTLMVQSPRKLGNLRNSQPSWRSRTRIACNFWTGPETRRRPKLILLLQEEAVGNRKDLRP